MTTPLHAGPVPGAAPKLAPRQRWAFLDQVRAWLMLLGIPYHVGLVYATRTPIHGPWLVSSPELSEPVTLALDFSHTFRMPVFFLLAGFFAMWVIRKRGPGRWCRSRLLRLGVPLVSSALVLSPLVMLAIAAANAPEGQVLESWAGQIAKLGPHWIVHLWFLSDLLILCCLCALLWHFRAALRLEPLLDRVAGLVERHWVVAPLLVLAVGCIAAGVAGAAKLLGIGYPLWGMIVPARLAGHGMAFLAGAMIAYRAGWLDSFTRPRPLLWALALLAAAAQMMVQHDTSPIARVLTLALVPVLGVIFAQVLLSAARHWLDKETPASRALVEASMTMYLVHVPIAFWLAVAMLETPLPPLLETVLLTAVTGLISFAIHRLLRRSALLSMLFNGQRYDNAKVRGAVPAVAG